MPTTLRHLQWDNLSSVALRSSVRSNAGWLSTGLSEMSRMWSTPACSCRFILLRCR